MWHTHCVHMCAFVDLAFATPMCAYAFVLVCLFVRFMLIQVIGNFASGGEEERNRAWVWDRCFPGTFSRLSACFSSPAARAQMRQRSSVLLRFARVKAMSFLSLSCEPRCAESWPLLVGGWIRWLLMEMVRLWQPKLALYRMCCLSPQCDLSSACLPPVLAFLFWHSIFIGIAQLGFAPAYSRQRACHFHRRLWPF